MVQTKFSRKKTKKQQNMVHRRSFACSSARRIGSLRKKVSQVLPQPGHVAWGRRFRRFFHGIRGRHSSSAGSHGRTSGTFFRWIQRKNLLRLLPPEPAEEPSPLSSAGFHGRTPSSASISNFPFHMCGRRFFSRKNLRLQPQPPHITHVVYPTTINASK